MAAGPTAIFVPTYGRAHKVASVLQNIEATTWPEHSVYLIVERDDVETIAAARGAGAAMIINPGDPSYASCMNAAFAETSEPFFFLGADDLKFHDSWLTAAVACMDDARVGVVGTSDPLHPQGDHSTHSLVRRSYVDEHGGSPDLRGTVFHGYRHNWTDWEIVCTAKIRGAYRFCGAARVDHLHPGWHEDGRVVASDPLFDATYEKGNRYLAVDTATFVKRSRLWRGRLAAMEPKNDADRLILGYVRKQGPLPTWVRRIRSAPRALRRTIRSYIRGRPRRPNA